MSVSLEMNFNLQTSASLEVSIIETIISGGYCCAEERDCGWVWEKVGVGGKWIGDISILDEDCGCDVRIPSHSSQQKQVERRAAEDAVPLQRPHLRGQDWGPEALLHQGSLPSSYNDDHHMFNIALISSIIMTLHSPERRVGPDDEEPLWRLQGQHWQDPWRV